MTVQTLPISKFQRQIRKEIIRASRGVPRLTKPIDAVIVLSGDVDDSSGSLRVHTEENEARLQYGLQVAQRMGTLLFLNATQEQLPLMRRSAIKNGFPAGRIVLMPCGVIGRASTLTQFQAWNKNPRTPKFLHPLFVTSWYHAPRVARTAAKLLPKFQHPIIRGILAQPRGFASRTLISKELSKIIKYVQAGDISR